MLRLLVTARAAISGKNSLESTGVFAAHEAARAEHSDKTP
jgi:hypothetical protein